MNYSAAVMLVNESIRAILCEYDPKDSTKKYIYKTLDASIKRGDLCVVPSTTRHNRTVVKVIDVDVDILDLIESTVQVEWIVGKIDNADYAAIKRVEDEAIQKMKDAEKLRKKKELQEKLFAHDMDLLKGLPISTMKSLPGATPEDTSAESVQSNPPFSYRGNSQVNPSDVEF